MEWAYTYRILYQAGWGREVRGRIPAGWGGGWGDTSRLGWEEGRSFSKWPERPVVRAGLILLIVNRPNQPSTSPWSPCDLWYCGGWGRGGGGVGGGVD